MTTPTKVGVAEGAGVCVKVGAKVGVAVNGTRVAVGCSVGVKGASVGVGIEVG